VQRQAIQHEFIEQFEDSLRVDQVHTMIGDNEMPLVTVVITLLVVGVLLWLVNRYIPMQGTIKGILNAVVVIVLVVWLIKVFGLLHYVTQFRVGP
jgi:hypothetical protein